MIYNKKYLDSKPTVPDDQLIVETVEYDTDELKEHCTVQYKYYVDKQLPRNAKGWRVYNLKCNYCDMTVRSADAFVEHIKTCEGLDDGYVKKRKPIRR